MDNSAFIPGLCIWLVALAFLVYQTWRQSSSGLMLSYCFQLWMLYWLGGFIHALPWVNLPNADTSFLGFQQSTYGLLAFTVGASLLGPRLGRWIVARRGTQVRAADPRLARSYVIFGLVSYGVLAPTVGRIAGLNWLPAIGSQFVVVGCCLACWQAWHSGGTMALLRTIAPAAALPMVTIIASGFLGFGMMALSVIMFFSAGFFRPRWLLIVGFLVTGYIGLSFYTSYMRDRNAIRSSVWGGESLTQRLDVLSRTVSNLDFFTLTNPEQLALVDDRLNQDGLVGAAVNYLSQPSDYARGATLWQAVLAMIPRLIWPSKTVSAGSGDLVSRFTGIQFAGGTSVGVTPVLEFYGNFGTSGVLWGFLFLGGIVMALDMAAGAFLAGGDWRAFTIVFLIGISFLNVGGQLAEVSMGAVGSSVLAVAVNRLFKARQDSLAQRQLRPVGAILK
jgi:hypothetical protein